MDWLQHRFELSRGSAAHNVRPMEGLRGFAVFLVFLVHFASLASPWLSPGSSLEAVFEAMQAVGNAGVDLFFVLSGYLIYGSLMSRHQRFAGFMARRIERIYPTFTVVLAIYLALSFAFPAESKMPGSFWGGLVYLVQNFLLLPGIFNINPMIMVAWSLSYEMFYYLIVPAAIAWLGLRERTSRWRVAFFLIVAMATALYCALHGGHVRLIMFLSGMLLHEAMAGDVAMAPGSGLGVAGLAGGLLANLLPVAGDLGLALKTTVLFVSFLALCLACFRDPHVGLSRAFSWTPLRWLGNMSYSYYLLHGLVLKACFHALAVVAPPGSGGLPAWVLWALLPTLFAITLLPSAALFLAVERPFSLAPRPRRVPGLRVMG